MIGAKTRLNLFQIEKTAREQACANQQQQGKRDLCGHQNLP